VYLSLDDRRHTACTMAARTMTDPARDPAVHRTVDDTISATARLSRAERFAIGAAQRSELPLDAHAEVPASERRGDPVAILTEQDVARRADLVPIRHGRMSATAFTFYRGAAAVMAADLSMVPTTELGVQLCGDAHLANFGAYNGPDRRLVFDLNDFDETHPGPFEWDVKRLAASLAVAARDNGLSDAKAVAAARAAVESYRNTIHEVAGLDPLALHYHRIEVEQALAELGDGATRRNREAVAKARKKNSLRAFDKLTHVVDGRRQIIDDPPLIERIDVLDDDTRADVRHFFEEYLASLPLARRRVLERYRLVDVARKVVGVGSVGTRCLIVLLESGDGDPLFLQFKQATRSVLEPYLGLSEFEQSGRRVVEGQRLMQAASDVFLGWARFDSQVEGTTVDFYFRQLWDGKGSAEIETMRGKHLRRYGGFCGGALALAHGRTGDAAMIAGYLGDDDSFDHAVGEFAMAYADLTERDHAAHVAAIDRGDVAAVSDL
jgi:uncharacterized protein (DUF2252 family)